MKQSALFAIALVVLLAVVAGATARWGDDVPDATPAARKMREQYEAVEKSAGIAPDRAGCETPKKFVPDAPFYYQCAITAPQVDPLRTALGADGWHAAPPGPDAGFTLLKGPLRSRLHCASAGTDCVFRLETVPRQAGS